MTEPKPEYTVAEMRELEKALAPKRKSKYNSEKVELDGHTFDSKAEARRYGELVLMQKADEIRELKVHPRYELQGKFVAGPMQTKYRAIVYEADFSYREVSPWGDLCGFVAEDVKGAKTAVFRLKEKLFRFKYRGIDLRILEV